MNRVKDLLFELTRNEDNGLFRSSYFYRGIEKAQKHYPNKHAITGSNRVFFARKSRKSGKNLPEIGLSGLHFWPQNATNSPLQEELKTKNGHLGIKVSPG